MDLPTPSSPHVQELLIAMFCKTLTDSNHPSRQAELACMVLHFLSEDLTQFDVTQGQEGSHL